MKMFTKFPTVDIAGLSSILFKGVFRLKFKANASVVCC